MRYYAIAWLLLLSLTCSCDAQQDPQQSENTHFSFERFEEEVMVFEPKQWEGVSDKSYAYAQMILDEVKSATKGKPENFNRGDYMNVLSAFLTPDISSL